MSKRHGKLTRAKAGTSKDAAAHRIALFVDAMVANGGNQTAAAITAGWNPRSARQRGHELVKDRDIAKAIERRRAEQLQRAGLDSAVATLECAKVLRADIRMLFDGKGRMLPMSEWPPEVATLVQSWRKTRNGVEVRLVGKSANLERAFKHLGLFEKDNRQQRDPILELLNAIAPHAGLVPITVPARSGASPRPDSTAPRAGAVSVRVATAEKSAS